MLYLNRRIGESVIIDNEIKVTIAGYDRGEVKLSFEAPADIEIWREEIYEGEIDNDSRRD